MNKFYRQIFKYKWILITFWSKEKSLKNIEKIFIMCYWNPSHPFDHNPQNLYNFFKKNFLLVFFDYKWTFWSDWICTFDNAVESVFEVIEFIKKWEAVNIRNNQEVIWENKEKILVWASYWWSVCLCVWAKSDDIEKIISLSPVISWKDFDKKNLENTYNFLQNVYNNFWRCDQKSLENFKNWKINLNPVDFLEDFENKEILLIQDKNDYQIDSLSVENFYKKLNSKRKKIYFENKKRHILLHNLSEKDIFENILAFIN